MTKRMISILIVLILTGCDPFGYTFNPEDRKDSHIKCTITSKTGNGCTVWRYTKWCNEVKKDQLPIDTLFLSPEQCSLKK